jgi:hypothetical protein
MHEILTELALRHLKPDRLGALKAPSIRSAGAFRRRHITLGPPSIHHSVRSVEDEDDFPKPLPFALATRILFARPLPRSLSAHSHWGLGFNDRVPEVRAWGEAFPGLKDRLR